MNNILIDKELFPVIGLEVHIHLNTRTKMFCSCAIEYGEQPNKNICPVCTGQPGVLPVLNKRAVELALKTAMVLNCEINKVSLFARKNYYYPDLPKNYQISQYELPLAVNGYVEISEQSEQKIIYIKRVHLEEDAGKLLHSIGKQELEYSLVDYNRASAALLEIVTEPCIFSPEDAVNYLTTLRNILIYNEISDCDMEKGTFRCDANVSLSSFNKEQNKIILGTKTELKNMNSFKSIKDALNYEIERQYSVIKKNEKVVQQTRLWNEKLGVTEAMRGKEEAHDYRYFPEPDLLPLVITEKTLNEVRDSLVELPNKRKERFKNDFGLSEYDAKVLVADKYIADFFENVINLAEDIPHKNTFAKIVCNLITTELLGKLNAENKIVTEVNITPKHIYQLSELIYNKILSSKLAKEVFSEVWVTNKLPEEIIKEREIVQISDDKELEKIVEEVMSENSKVVSDINAGKTQAISALVGAAMKKTKGKADPKKITELFKKKLGLI